MARDAFGSERRRDLASGQHPRRSRRIRWGVVVFGLSSIQGVSAQNAPEVDDPSIYGQWDGPYDLPVPTSLDEFAHAIVIPVGPDRGKVLLVVVDNSHVATASVWIWKSADPGNVTEVLTNPSVVTSNLFCSAHTVLKDGRIVFVGGSPDQTPSQQCYFYSPTPRTFTHEATMARRRFYPSALILWTGDVLVLGGTDPNQIPPVSGGGQIAWELLCPQPDGVWISLMDPDPADQRPIDQYPLAHLLSTGQVFIAADIYPFDAPAPAESMALTLSPPTLTSSQTSPTVVPPPASDRRYGTSVLIHEAGPTGVQNRVIAFGGWCNDSTQCPTGTPVPPYTALATVGELKDWATGTPPSWQVKQAMNRPRMYLHAVLLPNRKVFIAGGSENNYKLPQLVPTFPPAPPVVVKQAAIFDPGTPGSLGTWALMASHFWERIYHSTAVLLDDGRIAVIGGESDPINNPNNPNVMHSVEVFSPPYLFLGSRPSFVTSPPSVIGYGQQFTFTVQVPAGQTIGSVALIRSNSVSHHFDFDQRYVGLSFVSVPPSGNPQTFQATGPTVSQAPPGYYRLWVVTASGIPSVAAWVQVL